MSEKPTLQEIVSTATLTHSGQIAKNIAAANVIRAMLENMPPPKRLTRWERFKMHATEMPQRIRDAWKVLKGDAVIDDYY